ncbi:hypothetical protein BH23THE1_BH23THE1_18500 [soil metagenome]
MEYTIDATGIEGATAGHIHCGIEGRTDQSLSLYLSLILLRTKFLSWKISADYLTGPVEGMQVSDLVDTFNGGNSYANIHTEKKS